VIQRRFEEAVELARRALQKPEAQLVVHCLLTTALAHLGRIDEARQVWEDTLRLHPNAGIDHINKIFPFENPEYKDLILEGLYKAGMPRPD
jgi:adenylate cyclase